MHIDYLSLSDSGAVLNNETALIKQFDLMCLYDFHKLYEVEGGIWSHGRAPYKHSYKVHGASLFFSLGRAGALLELTGRGCDILRDNLRSMVQAYKTTRIDIAHDIVTGLEPLDVIGTKPTAIFDTSTGKTVYLGSMKSDAFCRVYRYAPPHPRSDKLRIEFVFRRKYAEKVVYDYARDGVKALVNHFMTRCKKLDISHGALDYSFEEVTYSTGTQKQNGTLTWYKKQVVPAIRKMILNNLITLDDIREDLSR